MRYLVGGCEWPNMYIFKSWSFVGTVTSFLEALRVLIEILSIICFFCSICRGEFITRKLCIYIYISVHIQVKFARLWLEGSKFCKCGKTIWSPRPELETMREAFPWKSFMTTTFQVNSSMFVLSNKWPTGSPAKFGWFRQFQNQLIFILFSYVWAGRSHLTQNVALCLVGWFNLGDLETKKTKKWHQKRQRWWSQGQGCFGYTTSKHAWSTTMGTGTV